MYLICSVVLWNLPEKFAALFSKRVGKGARGFLNNVKKTVLSKAFNIELYYVRVLGFRGKLMSIEY